LCNYITVHGAKNCKIRYWGVGSVSQEISCILYNLKALHHI